MSKCNKGISLLYVLAALIVAGFIGTALLKMSHYGTMTTISYKSSEIARSSVQAGFCKALSILESTDTDSVAAILSAWKVAEKPSEIPEKYVWLLGERGNIHDSSNTVALSENQRYRVKIIGVDFQNSERCVISLESEGVANRGVSKAIGTYLLDGLGEEEPISSDIPGYALYLGGGMGNVYKHLKVKGDVYIKNRARFETGDCITEIDGTFRTNRSHWGNLILESMHFTKNAYFGVDVTIQERSLTFEKSVGFERAVLKKNAKLLFEPDWTPITEKEGIIMTSGNTLYMNGGYYGQSEYHYLWGCDPTRLHLNGASFMGYAYENYATKGTYGFPDILDQPGNCHLSNKRIDKLPSRLGFSEEEPTEVYCNIDLVREYAIDATFGGGQMFPEGITGERLQAVYNTYYHNHKSKLFKGEFLVLNIKPTSNQSNHIQERIVPTTFNGKVIFIVENITMNMTGRFYNSGPDALTFFYVGEGGSIDYALWVGENDTFRGYIYQNSSALTRFRSTGGTIEGGVYVQSGIFEMIGDNFSSTVPQEGAPINFNYNDTVFSEFCKIGLLTDTEENGSSDTDDEILITANHLTSTLLSRSF